MCELLYLRRQTPFYLADVFPLATKADIYGIAGFGWGVAWVTETGELKLETSAGTFAKEYDRQMALAANRVKACLIHLRRPSFFSTLTVENSQPYLAEAEFAFGHNGFFANHARFASEFSAERQGTSDSEVGYLLYKSYLETMGPVAALERTLDEVVGDGSANVCIINQDGSAVVAGRNRDRNRLFHVHGNGFTGVATEMHSQDGDLLSRVYPDFTVGDEITEAVLI